ncbi:MAG TPA: hypothetical protein PLD25_18970 [Chloroflexota bacterium]|nr:hypothetical protein [Chloroflexota bacterium]
MKHDCRFRRDGENEGMETLSHRQFIATLPPVVTPYLPAHLQGVQVKQPWQWLVQFHFGEPRLHYEVSRVARRQGWELGFHCEATDPRLNRYLLDGFRRHLFEIKDTLGESVEAEMWDKGWTKIYEVYPDASLTRSYQTAVAQRLATIIICLHPIFVDLRGAVAAVYR